MFGKKVPQAKTVLLIDVESGSVATALISLERAGPATVLSHQRESIPLAPTVFSSDLARSLERVLAHSLTHTSQVAARMRVHAPEAGLGTVDSAAVFLAAPWGVPNLTTKGPEYLPGMREYLAEQVRATFGDIPVAFYTSADSLAFGSRALDKHDETVVVSLRGELIELLLLNTSGPAAYSTLPLGTRSVWRTLQSHGALSMHEAKSRLMLSRHSSDRYEPLLAAGRHLSEHVAGGVRLLLPAGTATSMLVVAEHPMGDWFAQTIAEDPLVSELFTPDSTVEALLPHHLAPRIRQGTADDPHLLLEAVLVDAKSSL